jgi:hypothetical protein
MPAYVEKIRVPVQIAQLANEPLAGFLALAPRAQFHDGPETLLELMNAPRRVIPVQLPDGETSLLQRDAIEWVTTDSGEAEHLVMPRNFLVTREEAVRVCLRNGQSIDGILRMELPEHLNRASDFLNASEDFFPLTRDTHTLLIHKSAVREVRLFDASPKPVGTTENAA